MYLCFFYIEYSNITIIIKWNIYICIVFFSMTIRYEFNKYYYDHINLFFYLLFFIQIIIYIYLHVEINVCNFRCRSLL